MDRQVIINVKPVAMIDEKLDIFVTGLEKGSEITLRSYLKQDRAEFEAYGHFISDSNGTVRLNEEPSVGGTYYGLEPMGLFWSMQLLPGYQLGVRYSHYDVTEPQTVTLTLYKGHVDTETFRRGEPIASTRIKRCYMTDEIEKVPVSHERIRGILFKPKGYGPFPGVIHINGIGLPLDHIPSRLASLGFAALQLFYLGEDDPLESVEEVDLEYFYETVDWLCREPYIAKGGIQLVGGCFGGLCALLLASKMPEKVTAVVSVNALTVLHRPSLKFKGKTLPHMIPDGSKFVTNSDGSRTMKHIFKIKSAREETQIKVENIRKMLFLVGEFDQGTPTLESVKQSIQRLQAYGHTNYEVLQYPGTGHIISIPYQPIITITRYKDSVMYWGGKVHAHARAEEDAWSRLKEFLMRNVSESSTASQGKRLYLKSKY